MRSTLFCSLVCVIAMSVPASAAAQGVPSDPDADSPSGTVYELPVERARQDAAPRERSRRQPNRERGSGGRRSNATGGSGAGGGTADGSNSSIRSENNFGTSSNVPGAASGGSQDRGDDDASNDKKDGSQAGGGGSGGGSAGDAEGADDVARVAAAADTIDSDGPSEGVVFPLLALLLAVGTTIAITASRRARGRRD